MGLGLSSREGAELLTRLPWSSSQPRLTQELIALAPELAARVIAAEKLAELFEELIGSEEANINAQYPDSEGSRHPVEQRRYDRDMEFVGEAKSRPPRIQGGRGMTIRTTVTSFFCEGSVMFRANIFHGGKYSTKTFAAFREAHAYASSKALEIKGEMGDK